MDNPENYNIALCDELWVVGVLYHFQQYFSNIVVVSFNGRRTRMSRMKIIA